jgi:hypothetical protein
MSTVRVPLLIITSINSADFMPCSISMEEVSTKDFWRSLGAAFTRALKSQAAIIIKAPQTREDIMQVCLDIPDSQRKRFLIFFDEFNELFKLDVEMRDEALKLLRLIRDSRVYKVGIIGIGTFSIRQLTCENVRTSPFNVEESFQNPNLSQEEVQSLFDEFGRDKNITFEDGVIRNLYFGTNGYVWKASSYIRAC